MELRLHIIGLLTQQPYVTRRAKVCCYLMNVQKAIRHDGLKNYTDMSCKSFWANLHDDTAATAATAGDGLTMDCV